MEKLKIAFGSCIRYQGCGIKKNQPVWDAIDHEDPDHLILLGDQIYMDFGWRVFTKEYKGKPADYTPKKFYKKMRNKYEKQWGVPNFQALLNHMRHKPDGYHATWDDHDFAWNNALGYEVDAKRQSHALHLFNEFNYGLANDDKVYKSFDTKGVARVIILDCRSFANIDPKKVDTEGKAVPVQMLGAEQFAWLADQIATNTNPYTIICGSVTFSQRGEYWARFEQEYQQFCDLVRGKKGVIYLSGDIHTNDFKRPGYKRRWFKKIEIPCYEVTSSGLANNAVGLPFCPDRQHNYGVLELDWKTASAELHTLVWKRSKRHEISW